MINPTNPPVDRYLKLVQRGQVADMPATPAAGADAAACFIDNDPVKRLRGLYFSVAVDAAGNREWFGPLTPSSPDQRFTLAPEAYELDGPGSATWTTLASAVGAALAGTGTSLGAASSVSPRMVWIMPHIYTGIGPAEGEKEALALYDGVSLIGASSNARTTVLENYAFTMPSGGRVVLRGIHFRHCSFASAMTDQGEIVFEDCQFEDCTASFVDTAALGPTYGFVRCGGRFDSFEVAPVSPCAVEVHFVGSNGAAPLQFAQSITAKGTGQVSFLLNNGHEIEVVTPHAPFAFEEDVYATLYTSNCFIVNSIESSVIRHRSSQLGEWRADPGTSLFAYPKSAFDTESECWLSGVEFLVRGNTSWPVGGGAMLDPISGGVVSFQGYAGNRQRVAQDFALELPAAGSSVTAQTLNGASNAHTSGYADVFRLVARYQAGYTLQGDSAIPATFCFATFLLKDPALLEDAREVVVVNAGGLDALDGPIALRLPGAGRVGVMQSNITTHPLISSAQYIILQPGQSVRLSVDRSGPVARYLAIA